MNRNNIITLIILFVGTSCFRRQSQEEPLPAGDPKAFPLDNLLKLSDYYDVISLYSEGYDQHDNEKVGKLLQGAWIQTVGGAFNGAIACVSIGMTKGPDMPRMRDLTPRWQTRAGLYIGMPLDSVQIINGRPFTITGDTAGVYSSDWNKGTLADTNTDVFFELDTTAIPIHEMTSSQTIINKRVRALVKGVVVWKPEYWPFRLKGARELPHDYMSLDPSLRYLNENDVKGQDPYRLWIMRYEIFARKGYIFRDAALRDYFAKASWYKPISTETPVLSEAEKFNINYLLVHQQLATLRDKTPLCAIISKLPIITLPYNVESFAGVRVMLPKGMPLPDGRDGENFNYNALWINGILADTSQFYTIVWRGPSSTRTEEHTYVKKITTYDKQFNRIDTGTIQVRHDRWMGLDGRCWDYAEYKSVMNADLSFESFYSAKVVCRDDTAGYHVAQSISGHIRKDGRIIANK